MKAMQELKGNIRNLHEKAGCQHATALILFFFALQLYLSLSAVIYQRIELENGKQVTNQPHHGLVRDDEFVVSSLLDSLASKRDHNSTQYRDEIKTINLQLKYMLQAAYEREKRSGMVNDFSYVFTFFMSSVSFVGIGDVTPSSPGSTIFFIITTLFGAHVVLVLIFKASIFISYLATRLATWMEQYKALSKVRPPAILFLMYLLLVLFGAPFYSSDYLSGLLMALDSVTKIGNYRLVAMRTRPRHPITAMIFSSYVLIGLSLFVLLIKPLVKTLGQSVDVDLVKELKELSQYLKIRLLDRDDDILEEDLEKGNRKSGKIHINTFDPPIRAQVRTRLKMYNRYVAKPRSPMLVIKEISPDLHGEFVNNYKTENNDHGLPSCASPMPIESINSDSWAEFIRQDEDKSSVSEYSFDGSCSSGNSALYAKLLQRRESGVSDTNVVTDYPWLDSNVNILELTEQNVKMMFGNDSPKSTDDSKDESGKNKRSLSRKNALNFEQRAGQANRRSSESEESEMDDFKRKISKSDERVNFCGVPSVGLLHRSSDISGSPRLLKLAELDGEEFTKSDFFTSGRPPAQRPRVKELVAPGHRGILALPNPSITVEKPASIIEESDCEFDYADYDCDHSSCSETGYEGVASEGRKSSAPSDNKDYLDVHVVSPGISGPQRSYQLYETSNSSSSPVGGAPSLGSGSGGKLDTNFARCFGGPARSLSDLSAASLRMIDMGDILYSDEETDSPDRKRPRVDQKRRASPLARTEQTPPGDAKTVEISSDFVSASVGDTCLKEKILESKNQDLCDVSNDKCLLESDILSGTEDIFYDCDWKSAGRRSSGFSNESTFFDAFSCQLPTFDDGELAKGSPDGEAHVSASTPQHGDNGSSLPMATENQQFQSTEAKSFDAVGPYSSSIPLITRSPAPCDEAENDKDNSSASVYYSSENNAPDPNPFPPMISPSETEQLLTSSLHAIAQSQPIKKGALKRTVSRTTAPTYLLDAEPSSYMSEIEARDTWSLVQAGLDRSTVSPPSTEDSSEDDSSDDDTWSDKKKLL